MLKRVFSDTRSDWQSKLCLILVFLFPVLVATMRDAGSVIYAMLVLLGLSHCKGVWGQLNTPEKRFLIGFVVFFFFSMLSLFMTEDMHEGLKRSERYLRLLGLIPIYLMLRKKKISSAKFYLAGAFLATFVMFFQAVYEVEVLKSPIASGAYHKIIFGNQAILATAFVVCGVLFFGKNKTHYMMAIIAAMAGGYASLLSGTRTSWLFILFILTCLAGLYRKKINRRIWTYFMSGILVTMVIIIVFKPERLLNGLEAGWNDLKTFQENPDKHSSLGARLVMWRNSILIFKASPIFGTGMGDFKHDSLVLFEKGLSYKNDFAVRQANAHNLYFQLLAEGGLIGLSLMVTTFFIFPFIYLKDLWQSAEDRLLRCDALCGLIGVLAFVWFGVSESWVNRNPMITTYCVTILVFMSSAAIRSGEITAPQVSSQ